MNYLLPERLDRLAREYALGTLPGPSRRRFERVLRHSAAATLAVGVWQERLATLQRKVPALEPREAVWRGLEQRLFAAPTTAPAVGSGSWLRRLLSGKHWAGAVAGVFLCALVLRLQPGLIGLEQGSEALPASYVGLLTDAAGQPSVLASSRRQGRQLTVKMLRPIVVPAGSVAMLWALPKNGAVAFAIGVVPASGSAIIGLGAPSERLFSNVSRLAVSIEPGPAKAGDRPSGEFVLTGHCVKLW